MADASGHGRARGSGTVSEINAQVLGAGQFTEAQQSVLHDGGPGTEIAYRLAWARTHLKGIEALENSARGVWTVTEAGRATPAMAESTTSASTVSRS